MTDHLDDVVFSSVPFRNDEGLQLFDVQQKRVIAAVKASKVGLLVFYSFVFRLSAASRFSFYGKVDV